MQRKNLPNQVNDQDLLDALNQTEEVSFPTLATFKFPNVTLFLSTYKITPGDYPIKKALLYKLYKQWAHEPIKKTSFVHELHAHFIYTQLDLYINHENFSMTDEAKKLLATPNNRTHIWDTRHYQLFLEQNGIEAGTDYFPSRALYYIYDNWHYDTDKIRRLTYYKFVNLCKLHFEIKKFKDTGLHFGITTKNFTPERIKSAYEWASKQKENDKEKKRIKNPKI